MKISSEFTEPSEAVRFTASYHRPKEGRWIADFNGTLRGVVFKKGNKDGTDMHVLVFNGLGGKDLMNAPVAKGMPYARQMNTIYLKTNVVNNTNSTKGRFPFGLQFVSAEVADAFELWLTSITGTKNCFLCEAPSTLQLLRAANAQVDAVSRSPEPSKELLDRAKVASPTSELTPVKPLKLVDVDDYQDKAGNDEGSPVNSEGSPVKSDKSDGSDDDVNYNVYNGSPILSQYWF